MVNIYLVKEKKMKDNIAIVGVGNITQTLLKTLVDKKFKGKVFIHDIDNK